MPNPSELERQETQTDYIPGGGVNDYSTAGSTVVGRRPGRSTWTAVLRHELTNCLRVEHYTLENCSREEAASAIKSQLRVSEREGLVCLHRGYVEAGHILI